MDRRAWNPVTGCDKVSAGCDHCYALTMTKRLNAMGATKHQTDGDPVPSGPGSASRFTRRHWTSRTGARHG